MTQPPRTLPLLAIGVVGMLVAQQALVVVGDALLVASNVDAQALPPLLRSELSTLSATLALQMLLDVGILIAWSGLMRWLVRHWVARG